MRWGSVFVYQYGEGYFERWRVITVYRMQQRMKINELDSEALAFRPVLGVMLSCVYHNHQDPEGNRERLQKMLQFWGAKEVFDTETINSFEREMAAGLPPPPLPPPPPESSVAVLSSTGGMSSLPAVPGGSVAFQYAGQWPSDQSHTSQPSSDQTQPPEQTQQPQASFGVVPPPSTFFGQGDQFAPPATSHFVAGSVPTMFPTLPGPPLLAPLPAPLPQNPSPPALAQLPIHRAAADQPPYPLFPPGLIPGMVRKMQIGSGVPYSPLSLIDIPTVIPPSTTTESYILERVTKFYKEIGEVDPLMGQVKASDGSTNESEGEGREGGARIPPPSHMQVDPETGTLPDGSVEQRPGVGSTGRLRLGAAADPNEVTQYDDVYTSYRKQRSTNYHTSLSARAAAAR